MITKEEIEEIRKALNMPEQHGSYEKHHNRAEQILDRLDKLVSSSNVIPDVSHSTTPSYLNDKYKIVQHVLDTYQVEKNGEPIFRGEKEECYQYVKDELGYCG